MSSAETQPNATNPPQQYEIVSGDAIASFIGIRPPDDASKSPPILSFRRKREVDIPWMTILSGGANLRGGSKSVAAIRSYFETSWGFEAPDSLKKWMDDKNELLGYNDAKREAKAYPGWIKRIANDAQSLADFSQPATQALEDFKKGFEGVRSRLAADAFSARLSLTVTQDTTQLISDLGSAKDAVRAAPRYISAMVESVGKTFSDWHGVLGKTDATPEPLRQLTESVSTALSLIRADAPRTPLVYRAQLDPTKAKDLPVDTGYIIRHGSSRLYLLIDAKENPLRDDDFLSYEKYQKAWDDKIQGIELVFESFADAQNCFMDIEEIDLQPPYIQRSHQRLKLQLDFARKIKDDVAKRVGSMIEKLNDAAISPGELEKLQSQVLKLELSVFDIERQIRRLASLAERLGYFLCIGSLAGESQTDAKTTAIVAFNSSMRSLLEKDVETATRITTGLPAIGEALNKLSEYEKKKNDFLLKADTLFGGPPFEPPAEPGKIYTTYQRTARWNVLVPTQVPVQVGAWFWRHTVQKTVEFARPLEAVVTKRKEVDVNKDRVEARRTELVNTGMQVYVFKKTPTGFLSEDGVPLQQIMDRCNFDEMFRRHCVVLLPVYRESMTGQRLLTKYLVFKRPMPGIVPSIMPRLSLEESLSYRTAWLQTKLGEMVSSINLAPGEERQVKISKSYEQETTLIKTSNSIFDVTSTESTDLASEMENQARHEQESSKSMEFSAKASGSYMGFSAEASASGGTKSSLKDMNQAISKVAKKAAQSVSSHNKQEVSSSSTARTKISNVDETSATIRNINQGRSLNLFFYRLYNKYKGGLYLENLRFDVIQSVEVIAGSGVHESRSYGLDQLAEMIAEFMSSHLPFAVSNTNLYTCHLLDSIEKLLRDEYTNPAGSATIFTSEKFKQGFEPTPAAEPAPDQLAELARQKLDHLLDALRNAVIHSHVPIAPQELLVAAPGLYLDAAVGAQPSTEPYSEDMRKQEVRMRQAEVFVKESEGFGNQAKAAAQLAQLQNETANCITGMLADPATNSLALSLKLPLPAGDWWLVCKAGQAEEDMAQVSANSAGKYLLRFTWSAGQQWLEKEALASQITLVNRSSKDRIAHFSALQMPVAQP